MLDSKPRDQRVPIHVRLAEKWRFIVIMIANVWLVFVIMRFGLARQELPEHEPPVAEYSLMTTLLASTVLVATVLGLVGGALVWRRSRLNRRHVLAVYRSEDGLTDSTAEHRSRLRSGEG